jgi:hypothetical protein
MIMSLCSRKCGKFVKALRPQSLRRRFRLLQLSSPTFPSRRMKRKKKQLKRRKRHLLKVNLLLNFSLGREILS